MILDRAAPDKVQLLDCRYGRMLALTNDRYIGHALAHYGEYSESEVELWRQILPPHAIAADVGANLGAHTVALASLLPQGFVFAFEPLRYIFGLLSGNLCLNGITNAWAYHAAVGAQPGKLFVPGFDYTRDDNYGGIPLGTFQDGNPVPRVRLDDICQRLHFIKADVEGMEGDVLRGAERLIRECRPVLYVEANPDPALGFGEVSPSQQALIDQMHGYNYRLWWHLAPHYNPNNHRHAAPLESPNLVSSNILGLPAEGEHHIEGLDVIEKRAQPLPTIT